LSCFNIYHAIYKTVKHYKQRGNVRDSCSVVRTSVKC